MKYIKKFEYLLIPQIGDYILTNKSLKHYDDHIVDVYTFMNNNIGRIIDIRNDYYVVQYDNIPRNLRMYFNQLRYNSKNENYKNYRVVKRNEILFFSNKLFDINIIKNTQKYNL